MAQPRRSNRQSEKISSFFGAQKRKKSPGITGTVEQAASFLLAAYHIVYNRWLLDSLSAAFQIVPTCGAQYLQSDVHRSA